MNKVSQNRQKKEKIVAEISEKVNRAKAMVFTNYQGLTHKQLEGLKKEIKKADAEFAVTKNTLLKIALEKAPNANLKSQNEENKLDGQTGTMFLYADIVTPLKALAKMIKEMEKPQVKFGLMEGKLLTSEDVLKLSTLPSREVLLAQLANVMLSPIQRLHRTLSWNPQQLVLTLSAIYQKKS